MKSIRDILSGEIIYERVIEDYCRKKQGAVKYSEIVSFLTANKKKLAKVISGKIKTESFTFSFPQQTRLPETNGVRIIFPLIDLLVLKALLEAINPFFIKTSSKNLFSFMKGRNFRQIISYFTQFLFEHTKLNHNHVDLWIYKTDINHYSDSMPVHQNSMLWPMLRRLLLQSGIGNGHSHYIENLYFQAARPTYISLNGNLMNNLYGVPFGSPIFSVLGNLYLSHLDWIISTIPNIFYARYGDDILVAHHEKAITLKAIKIIQDEIYKAELSINKQKEQFIYYTLSGRSPDNEDLFKGSNKIHFVGFKIYANGKTISTHKKIHRFLLECHAQILQQAKFSKGLEISERGKTICGDLQKLFDVKNNSELKEILLRTNDHKSLAQLDHQIALWITNSLTSNHGLRAFRQIPYRIIHNQWHLPSLEMLRNKLKY